MLDLLKNKVDYSLRQLLGFEMTEETAALLHRSAAGRELVLLSRLIPKIDSGLALLGPESTSDVSETALQLASMFSPKSKVGDVQHAPIYPINQHLKDALQAHSLKSLEPGYLFLNHQKIRLSREDVNELIFEFQLQALKPVLLFPETNPLFIKTPKLLSGLEHRGTLFLIDWRSLTGENGHLSYKIASHLLENQSVMGIGFKSADFKNLGKLQKINKTMLRYLGR